VSADPRPTPVRTAEGETAPGAAAAGLPMSMYTQLLDAAFGRRGPVLVRPTKQGALDALWRRRRELNQDVPPTSDPDAVPAVLAREIGYDVALLELAEVWGIESDPSHFEQPRLERSRLEQALRDRGVTLPSSDRSAESAPGPG
jgi:hypothetical protein